MDWRDLFLPHNLPFSSFLGFALFLFFAQYFGADGHEAGAGAHDMDGHDLSHDTDHSGDHSHDSESMVSRVLSIFGIGRAPLMVVLYTFFASYGALGIVCTALLGTIGIPPTGRLWIALLAVLPLATIVTRLVSVTFSKAVPQTLTLVTHLSELVGKTGTVTNPVTEDFGLARVYDAHMNQIIITCHTAPGEPPIPEGASVVLMEYDPEQKTYRVRTDKVSLTA